MIAQSKAYPDLTVNDVPIPIKNLFRLQRTKEVFGRGTKIRTQKNGFGDRYVTITSCP